MTSLIKKTIKPPITKTKKPATKLPMLFEHKANSLTDSHIPPPYQLDKSYNITISFVSHFFIPHIIFGDYEF